MERRRQTPVARLIYAAVVAIVRGGLFGLLRWRADVQGLDHVPRDGGAIVAFNHHSYVDYFMVGVPVYRTVRRFPRFLAKAELLRPRFRGWIFRATGQVPVERASDAGRESAFATAVERLRGGALIAIAPEQTISQSFELLPFRTGVVRMAQAAAVPIIPAVAWGDQRFLTKGRRPRLATGLPVLVRYGEPIRVTPEDEPGAATARLQEVMAGMLDEAIRAYPDVPAEGDDWWLPARYGGGAPPHDVVVEAHLERQRAWDDDDEQRAS